MKLYYSPGACSLTQHILLCEVDLPFSIEAVNLKDKITATGKNFYQITERGQVPALELNDGTILTENIAIAQYIADTMPEKNILAPIKQIERYQTIAWFNYIATEIHKSYMPIFRPTSQEATDGAIKNLIEKYHYIDSVLAKTSYIAGEQFTIADAYLFVTTRWSKMIPNCPVFPNLEKFMARMHERPAVQRALSQESNA